MLNIDSNVIAAFRSNMRRMSVRATFNDNEQYVIDGDNIKSFTITDAMCSTQTLSLGNVCSNTLTLDMYLPSDFVGLENSKVKLELGIEVNGEPVYTNLGIFYIDDITSNDNFKSVTLTGFDAMIKVNELGNSYTCKKSGSTVTAVDVIKDIANQAGIPVNIVTEAASVTKSENRSANNCSYDTSGNETIASGYYGINKNNLVLIPAQTSSIALKIFAAGQLKGTLQVCCFSDAQGNDFIQSYQYSGLDLEDTLDIETGEYYTLCNIDVFNPFNQSTPYYMGFSIQGSDGDTYRVDVKYKEQPKIVNATYKFTNPGTVDISPRTMLGYMAGMLGGNAKIDKDGTLVITTYENAGGIIMPEQQFMSGFSKTRQNRLPVKYLTTGSEPNSNGQGKIITVGSGSYGFNFANPYISDKTLATNIFSLYNNMSIMPCSVKYRGDISIESGDIITVVDVDDTEYSVLVCQQTLSFSGGFSVTIQSELTSDAKADFISTPSTTTVTQHYNNFDQQYQEIIGQLTGVTGGYVQFVFDGQGKMRAIAIPDSDVKLKWDSDLGQVVAEDGNSDVAMWVWSNGGLGYTNDGGSTYEIVNNKEGQAYANYLLAAKGTIGGWTADDVGLYTDYTFTEDSEGDNCYRIYLQNRKGGTWAISTQKGTLDDSGHFSGNGTFVLFYDGKVTMYKPLTMAAKILNANGDDVLNPSDTEGRLVIGLGNYNNSQETWLEGFDVNLRANNNRTIKITNYVGSLYDGDSSTTSRAMINGNTGTIISANGGSNALYLLASTTRVINDLQCDRMLNAKHGIIVDGSGDAALGYSSGYGVYVSGNSHNLKLEGLNYVQCVSTFKLSFQASSGTVPLAVNTSGEVVGTSSSVRYKENIELVHDEELNPDRLYDLPVKQYNYKSEYKSKETHAGTQIGITAEDVNEYYPNAVILNEDGQPESWHERIMIPAMLKLIQEQKQEIDELRLRLDVLEKEVRE